MQRMFLNSPLALGDNAAAIMKIPPLIICLVVAEFVVVVCALSTVQQITHHIEEHQNPTQPCRERNLLLLHFVHRESDGLGSLLHTAASAIAEGIHLGRTVVLAPSNWSLTTSPIHSGGPSRCSPAYRMECFFEQLSTQCDFEGISKQALIYIM